MPRLSRDQRLLDLLEHHRSHLGRLCAGWGLSPAEVEERAFEVALALWRCLPRANGDEQSWVYRVALNALVWWQRDGGGRGVPPEGEPRPPSEPGDPRPDGAARLATLHRILATLDAADRSLLILHLEGLSQRQIAAVLGIDEARLAARLDRLVGERLGTLVTETGGPSGLASLWRSQPVEALAPHELRSLVARVRRRSAFVERSAVWRDVAAGLAFPALAVLYGLVRGAGGRQARLLALAIGVAATVLWVVLRHAERSRLLGCGLALTDRLGAELAPVEARIERLSGTPGRLLLPLLVFVGVVALGGAGATGFRRDALLLAGAWLTVHLLWRAWLGRTRRRSADRLAADQRALRRLLAALEEP